MPNARRLFMTIARANTFGTYKAVSQGTAASREESFQKSFVLYLSTDRINPP